MSWELDTCLFFSPSGSGYRAIRPVSKKEVSRQGGKVVKREDDVAERKLEGHVTAKLLKSGHMTEKMVKFSLFLIRSILQRVLIFGSAGLTTSSFSSTRYH